jgi:para-nitrobenzyl esterase
MTKTPDDRIDRRTILSLAAFATAAATGALALPPARSGSQPGRAARDVPIPTPVVQTMSGAVQGLVENGVLAFKGIRYGTPPVGKLRFMPPRPAEPWTGIYDATDFGAPAMQVASGVTVNTASNADLQMHRVFTTPSDIKIMNEDCLFLNVWTLGTDDKRRPVMLWIHGGGFAYGSGAQPIYQCDGLAKFGDVVTVSVNHRLNVFGYLNLADLMGPDYASSGTVGMQDLVLALQWIRDNIAKLWVNPAAAKRFASFWRWKAPRGFSTKHQLRAAPTPQSGERTERLRRPRRCSMSSKSHPGIWPACRPYRP